MGTPGFLCPLQGLCGAVGPRRPQRHQEKVPGNGAGRAVGCSAPGRCWVQQQLPARGAGNNNQTAERREMILIEQGWASAEL